MWIPWVPTKMRVPSAQAQSLCISRPETVLQNLQPGVQMGCWAGAPAAWKTMPHAQSRSSKSWPSPETLSMASPPRAWLLQNPPPLTLGRPLQVQNQSRHLGRSWKFSDELTGFYKLHPILGFSFLRFQRWPDFQAAVTPSYCISLCLVLVPQWPGNPLSWAPSVWVAPECGEHSRVWVQWEQRGLLGWSWPTVTWSPNRNGRNK